MIRPFEKKDTEELIRLMRDFRVHLAGLKESQAMVDTEALREELEEYLSKGYPVLVAQADELLGYMVLRIDKPCLWLESIYVRESARRKGLATELFRRAEQEASQLGEETLYVNVHPNNHHMLLFLKSKGYDVLNLIEVRQPYRGELLTNEYRVGEHLFRY